MPSLRTELDGTEIEVTAKDLPLHCPLPSQKLWNTHPRVFLDARGHGRGALPFRSTLYTLAGGPDPAATIAPAAPGHARPR